MDITHARTMTSNSSPLRLAFGLVLRRPIENERFDQLVWDSIAEEYAFWAKVVLGSELKDAVLLDLNVKHFFRN